MKIQAKKLMAGIVATAFLTNAGIFYSFAEDGSGGGGTVAQAGAAKNKSAKLAEWKKLKEENPERFHEMMENKMQRLKELKEHNPERYEQFLKNHPRIADRIEDRRDRREDRHDLRKDRRDGREDRHDRRKDRRDRREYWHDKGPRRGEELGVRDSGQGLGQDGGGRSVGKLGDRGGRARH